MRRLILLRHAKTERDAPSGRDIDRRLDERGVEDAALVGRWLAKKYAPDLALVSSAARAQETWEIFSKSLPETLSEEIPDLYGADAGELLHIIQDAGASNAQRLMIVAHNPGLHELALALIADGERASRDALASNLPTTGVAVIDFEIEDWNEVRFRGGTLERFVSPKILKD